MSKQTMTIDQMAINTIRTLSIDAIEKAKSVIQGCLWEPHQWRMPYGADF